MPIGHRSTFQATRRPIRRGSRSPSCGSHSFNSLRTALVPERPRLMMHDAGHDVHTVSQFLGH